VQQLLAENIETISSVFTGFSLQPSFDIGGWTSPTWCVKYAALAEWRDCISNIGEEFL